MAKFCEHLKIAIADEQKAGPDYIKLLGELQHEFGGTLGRTKDILDDLRKIQKISADEDAHHEALIKIYERRCKG